jgi:hypothetical protein
MSVQQNLQQSWAKSLSNMGVSKDFKSLASTHFAIRAARSTNENSPRLATPFRTIPRATCNTRCNSNCNSQIGASR